MKKNNFNNSIDDKSGGEMLSEILALMLKLLVKCLYKLLKFIFKLTFRILKLCFKLIKILIRAFLEFWNDNSTQEKLHIARLWCLKALKTLSIWLLIGVKQLWKGLKWLVHALIRSIIHLQSTLVIVSRQIVKGIKLIWKVLKQCGKNIRNFSTKQKQNYYKFRKNKGVKGLLIDTKNSLQRSLDNYMKDETDEVGKADNEPISYEEFISEGNQDPDKPMPLARKLYDEMKRIFDD